MQHQDPAVAIPLDLDERSELDKPIAYIPTPSAHGVPLSLVVRTALDVLDGALDIARRSTPGITIGDLVADLRAEQARTVGT